MEDLTKNIQIIRESQVRMEQDLKYHIKRTDLLERKIEADVAEVHTKLAPIHKAHTVAVGVIKLVLLAGAIAAAVSRFL